MSTLNQRSNSSDQLQYSIIIVENLILTIICLIEDYKDN
jgi:hypothetical protein